MIYCPYSTRWKTACFMSVNMVYCPYSTGWRTACFVYGKYGILPIQLWLENSLCYVWWIQCTAHTALAGEQLMLCLVNVVYCPYSTGWRTACFVYGKYSVLPLHCYSSGWRTACFMSGKWIWLPWWHRLWDSQRTADFTYILTLTAVMMVDGLLFIQ